MSKEKLIELINSLPDDLQAFSAPEDELNAIDLRIFVEPKSEEFLSWYFGM